MISLENARHCLNQLDANQLKPILTLLIVIACALYLPVLTVCFFFSLLVLITSVLVF